jgi:predicted O-methyltransferase YrrM
LFSARRIAYLYLAYFSKPVSDRALYRAIYRNRWQRILEIGVGSGRRALRMLDVASRHHPNEELFYVGIDEFEARPADRPGLSLKEAHRQFKARQFKAQLLPGDPYSTLMRAANALRNIDLVVVSAEQNAASLAQAWFYLPRVLHATSVVFQELAAAEGPPTLVALDRATIEARAQKPHRRSVA